MAYQSTRLFLALLLAVAAVVESDPIFFSKKNSRESDRSRERASLSSFRTSTDDSDEKIGGKTIRTRADDSNKNPLLKFGLNFEREIIVSKPVVPIKASGEISKIGTTTRRLDDDSRSDHTDDLEQNDEISLEDGRLTTQKVTNQPGPLASLRDVQATLRQKRSKRDSFEDTNNDSQVTDQSDEAVQKNEDEDLDGSNRKRRLQNPLNSSSSFGRPMNFPPSFSLGQPVKVSVSRKSSVSSVVGRALPSSSHKKGKDQKKAMSGHSLFTRISIPKENNKTGQSDENDGSASYFELNRKTTSRGRPVTPVGTSQRNQIQHLQNALQKNNGQLVVIRAGARTRFQNPLSSKSEPRVKDKVSNENSQEIFNSKDSKKDIKKLSFGNSDLTESFEKVNKDRYSGTDDNIDSNEGEEIVTKNMNVVGHVNYNTPELDQSEESSSKFISPVLPEIVLSIPSSKTKVAEDFNLESSEELTKSSSTYRIPDPEPKYVPPVYVPSSQKHPTLFRSERPSSLSHSSSNPNLSSLKFTLDDSDESEIKSLKPVNDFQNTHLSLTLNQRPASEVIDFESDETFEDISLYQPDSIELPFTYKHIEIESDEIIKEQISTSHVPLRSQKQFNSDELEIEFDEYVVHKPPTHETTSYPLSLPFGYGSQTKYYSPQSLRVALPPKSYSSVLSSPTLNFEFESDEISIESVPDILLFDKTPQYDFSHYSAEPLEDTTTSKGQKYLPPTTDISSSSSNEFESHETKVESDEAPLEIIPAVRLSPAYSTSLNYRPPPHATTVASPKKPTSTFRKNTLHSPNLSSPVRNQAPRKTYKSPKQTQIRYPPVKQYSAPLLKQQRVVSRPKVTFKYHQNSKPTKTNIHPQQTIQNPRVVYNKVTIPPQLISHQKFITTIQPKPIQGLLLQPQQPMRYGGQFTQYVRQNGRAFKALLLTPLNTGKNLNYQNQQKYYTGTYGLKQTNVPSQTVRQPIWTYPINRRPNLNAGLLNKKKTSYSTSSLPKSPGFLNLGSVGVPLPRQQPIKTFSTFSTDSDETIIQKSLPVIAPNYAAPVEASYQAPQQSYEAPAVCEPVVQYSVVTHDVLVPTTVEVYRTKYLPTTQYNQLIETKYYAKPQVNVVTVTSVPEPQIVTQTEVATNPVYVAQTNYETVTKYLTATQANIVTDTRVLFKTQYNTVTDVQYRTQTQYQTKTKYRTEYRTQTEINYQTRIEYQTQYLTSTAISKVPVYNTVTETQVKKQYVTETVPAYRTLTTTQEKYITQTVTSQYPFYTTVISTQYHPQYVTVTVTEPCNQGYGVY